MVVKHSYTRSRGAARAAVKYYQLRPRGEDEEPRSVFSSSGNVSRAEAISLINDHQHGNYVVHRITLSPSFDERPEDLVEMTCYAMSRWQQEREQALHWVAVIHRNTDNPHVHVVIAGTGERHADGATRGVKITKEDYAILKEESRQYCRVMAAAEGRQVLQPERGARSLGDADGGSLGRDSASSKEGRR